MRKLLPIFLLLISFETVCQETKEVSSDVLARGRPDITTIQKNIADSTGPYFYPKLSYQFRLDPGMPDSVGMQHLYYGKIYARGVLGPFDKELFAAMEYLKNGKEKEAIEAAEKLIVKDPTNLKLLGLLMHTYGKHDSLSENLQLYRYQVKRILDCMIASGDGKTENTPYYVSSVSDSYILMDVLGKNAYSFKRHSRNVSDGVMDVYKKGFEKIHIIVLYSDKY